LKLLKLRTGLYSQINVLRREVLGVVEVLVDEMLMELLLPKWPLLQRRRSASSDVEDVVWRHGRVSEHDSD
jgi:hypothetical protein